METSGAEEGVLISEVRGCSIRVGKGALVSEVSSVGRSLYRGFHCV